MAFEIVNPEFIPVENGTQDHKKGNGLSEPITFGSHGPKEAVDGPKAHLPKDAIDDWASASKVHSFYFVRYRTFDDPKIKAKLDAAEKDVRNKIDARAQIIEKIRALRTKRSQISGQITPLSEENQRFNEMLDGKKKEMAPLNEVLSQIRPNNSRERGVSICSSEAELNKQIKSLENRIQHESIPLSEEKQILREIKQLEGTRPQVIAIAQRKAEIEESSGIKTDIKDQYKLMGDDFGGVKKEKKIITAKLTQLLDERKAIDVEIKKLEVELKAAEEKRDKSREVVLEWRKKLEEGNASFYVHRMVLNKAKFLANNKDIEALTDISNSEIEKFMKTWNENKLFRDDYEKRILVSLDNRQLSRDGRIRNPEEKPLVVPEPSIIAKPEQVSAAFKPKQTKKEAVEENKKAAKEVKSKELVEAVEDEDEEKSLEAEKPKKVEKKVDEKKLKEIRREEEVAKAKAAAERKKKLAEKAAAKAAVKAQKEAEKKEKDREKKLKKKGLIPKPEEQLTEAEAEVVELEKPEEAIEETLIVTKSKSKGRKASTMKNVNRIKGPDSSISKAILKRKKSTTYYWVWAAPAAFAVMIAFVIGYKYMI